MQKGKGRGLPLRLLKLIGSKAPEEEFKLWEAYAVSKLNRVEAEIRMVEAEKNLLKYYAQREETRPDEDVAGSWELFARS